MFTSVLTCHVQTERHETGYHAVPNKIHDGPLLYQYNCCACLFEDQLFGCVIKTGIDLTAVIRPDLCCVKEQAA